MSADPHDPFHVHVLAACVHPARRRSWDRSERSSRTGSRANSRASSAGSRLDRCDRPLRPGELSDPGGRLWLEQKRKKFKKTTAEPNATDRETKREHYSLHSALQSNPELLAPLLVPPSSCLWTVQKFVCTVYDRLAAAPERNKTLQLYASLRFGREKAGLPLRSTRALLLSSKTLPRSYSCCSHAPTNPAKVHLIVLLDLRRLNRARASRRALALGAGDLSARRIRRGSTCYLTN